MSPEAIVLGVLAGLGILLIVISLATLVFWIGGDPIHLMDDFTFNTLHHRAENAERRLDILSGWQPMQNGKDVVAYIDPKYTWIIEKANRQNKADWEAYYAATGAKEAPDLAAAPPAPPTPEEELAAWRKEHIGEDL